MAIRTADELTFRVDQLLEGVITQIRVTDKIDVNRADLLKLMVKRMMRLGTQRLQRAETGGAVTHFPT
jgi:hypothetical protein